MMVERNFNPRTPYGVRPSRHSTGQTTVSRFQSTHPIRGATPSDRTGMMVERNFNPRTPYGVRLDDVVDHVYKFKFQSTHPIRGATTPTSTSSPGKTNFNPRTPYGVRPQQADLQRRVYPISIHAPHTGCDRRSTTPCSPPANFNPRTPYGVRRADAPGPDVTEVFQSTHPIRGATGRHHHQGHRVEISIHAPHTGCDGKFDDFNPLNLHKRYKRVLDRPKSTSEQGKNKAKLAYIHVFTVFGGCEGAGTVCALLLRTQYC